MRPQEGKEARPVTERSKSEPLKNETDVRVQRSLRLTEQGAGKNTTTGTGWAVAHRWVERKRKEK